METASHAEVPSRARWVIKGEGATRSPGAALPWLAGSARVPRKKRVPGHYRCWRDTEVSAAHGCFSGTQWTAALAQRHEAVISGPASVSAVAY